MSRTATPGRPHPGSAISVRHVRKAFGESVALDDVSFEVDVGEMVALLGPNGAGKTTLVGALLGLLRPDTGSVAVLSGSPCAAAANGRLGAMLQAGGLPDGVTVAEVVGLFAALYPRARPVADVLEQAAVADLAARRLETLSSGQAQRVRFALAIVGDPEIVFLDEPTAGMDIEARQALWNTMRAWAASGRTLVFATHYLDEVEASADRLLLLRRGSLVADGPPNVVRGTDSGKTITFRTTFADHRELERLPGATHVAMRRGLVTIKSIDPDGTVAALFRSGIDTRDLEVTGAALQETLLELTKSPR